MAVENSKKRKPNFSDAEKIRLIEEYEKEKEILSGKFGPNITSKRKHEAWLRVTKNMNSQNPSVVRTPTELQKKWQNLSSTMKDDYRHFRKETMKTGGGPPPEQPSAVSQKMCTVLGEDDPTVHGIPGGIDSLVCGENSRSSSDTSAVSFNDPSCRTPQSGSQSFSMVALTSPSASINASTSKRKISDNEVNNNELHRELLQLEKKRCLMEIEKLELEIFILKDKKKEILARDSSRAAAGGNDTLVYMEL